MSEARVISPQVFPFDVHVAPPPLLAVGADVRLCVTVVGMEPAAEVIAEFDGFVDAFCMLASSGGLSGETIAPHDSLIADKHDVIVQGNVLTWDLIECRVDERALLVLLNLLHFLHARRPVAAIELSTADSARMELLSARPGIDDYYPLMAQPPFALNIDHPISESLHLSILFERGLSNPEVEAVEEELLSWSVAPSIGAFAVPGLAPEASGMLPDQSVEAFDDEIAWSIDRFRMDPAAIDSLINCCAALSRRIAGIRALEVS